MDENIKYVRGLIKGKITETIFEEMFRTTGKFTIIPFGYEHTVPELAQYQEHVQVKKVLENIKNAPDFIIISQDRTEVYLVEVKYRNVYSKNEVLQISQELLQIWNPSYLFLATSDRFYFSPCNRILINGGEMELLDESWIPNETQEKYNRLFNEFNAT